MGAVPIPHEEGDGREPAKRKSRDAAYRQGAAYQLRRELVKAGKRCLYCKARPLPGKTKCLHHYVRGLLHGAARVNTGASLEAGAPAFTVDDAAVEWALGEFEKQRGRCYLSGRPITIGENATLDHVLSRARYVRHHIAGGLENLRWADADVNRAKNQLTPEAFLALCQSVVDWQNCTAVARANREQGRPPRRNRSRKVAIEWTGGWASLRTTLPPKPGSGRARDHGQRISLGIQREDVGAESLAAGFADKLRRQLLEGTFSWSEWGYEPT